MTHTPGPWQFQDYNWKHRSDDNHPCISGKMAALGARPTKEEKAMFTEAKGFTIFCAGRFGSIFGRTEKEAKANACLIEAAPDLLEALIIHHKHCIATQENYSDIGEDAVAYRATRNAINKALGRKS